MFYLSTIIDIFVRKIILIFCCTVICFCASIIVDAVVGAKKPKSCSGNNDCNCVETALKDVNLEYKMTPHSELGFV